MMSMLWMHNPDTQCLVLCMSWLLLVCAQRITGAVPDRGQLEGKHSMGFHDVFE